MQKHNNVSEWKMQRNLKKNRKKNNSTVLEINASPERIHHLCHTSKSKTKNYHYYALWTVFLICHFYRKKSDLLANFIRFFEDAFPPFNLSQKKVEILNTRNIAVSDLCLSLR